MPTEQVHSSRDLSAFHLLFFQRRCHQRRFSIGQLRMTDFNCRSVITSNWQDAQQVAVSCSDTFVLTSTEPPQPRCRFVATIHRPPTALQASCASALEVRHPPQWHACREPRQMPQGGWQGWAAGHAVKLTEGAVRAVIILVRLVDSLPHHVLHLSG